MAEKIIRPHHYQLPIIPFSQGKNPKSNKTKISYSDLIFILLIFLIFAGGVYTIEKTEPNYNLLDAVFYSGYNLRYILDFITNSNTYSSTLTSLSTNINSNQNENPENTKIESSEPHWEYMPVSYSFSNPEDCGGFQTRRILRAFDEISNATQNKITFIQLNNSGSINIICNKNFLPSDEPGLLQSGEATVSSLGNIILSADINFYNTAGDNYNGGCRNYPDVEIHEILHAFGIPHTDEEYNIMNPIGSYCPTKINQDIIDYLLDIYG
jgi:hypothetical protein